MKLPALLLLISLLAVTHSTVVTFYVDHEVQQPLDYVEISAIVKTNSESLEEAISDAAKIIQDIRGTVDVYCHSYAKDRSQCKDITQSSPYSIKPQYLLQKKTPQFQGFVVAHEILIKVKEAPLFGKLVDDILKKGVDKIDSLQWKPLEELDGEEIAVEEGIAQAHQYCEKIGMKLSTIISVQEVTDFGEEEEEEEEEEQGEEGEDGEDEQEQQQEQQQQEAPPNLNDDIVYYKFVIECNPKRK